MSHHNAHYQSYKNAPKDFDKLANQYVMISRVVNRDL